MIPNGERSMRLATTLCKIAGEEVSLRLCCKKRIVVSKVVEMKHIAGNEVPLYNTKGV